MPLTELWLSTVSANRPPGANGYASPTSRNAALALAVNTQRYSSRGARRKSQTACRACSTSSDEAAEAGLFECGLPRTRLLSSAACAAIWPSACSPPPV